MTDRPSSTSSTTMTRRSLLQRACFAGALVAIAPILADAQTPTEGLTPAQQAIDASGEFANPNWKPLFFSDEQNETVAALCDVMIPVTQTPGAKQAMVNRYADLVLSAESPQAQTSFVAALQHIDDESSRVYGKAFRALSADEQVEVLIPMALPMQGQPGITGTQADASYAHFARVKGLIVEGYYSSEIGDTDLGWDGAFSHGRYEGCESGEKKSE
jgi:hypothetical protein